jgi:hypothetical protein
MTNVTHKGRLLLGVFAALAFGSGAVAVAERATSSSPPADLSLVSNQGHSIVLPPDARTIRDLQARDVTVLGIHRRRAFYRLTRVSGETCYASGPADSARRLGLVICPRNGFPSQDQPVLDFSTFEITRDAPQPHLIRLEGVAADGVVSVAVAASDGATIAQSPVRANVYHADFPRHEPASKLIAYGAAGDAVYTLPLNRGN